MSSTSIPSGHHLAAILLSKESPLTVSPRPTPTPGPTELLIAVHSIALNPIDWAQRDYRFGIAQYPAVMGSDIAGTIISAGSSVTAAGADTHWAKPGTRIAAFAPSFFVQGAPDYGALQTRVLVPVENAVPLPESMSFNEGSLLPMAVLTAWSGWYSIGVERDAAYTEADKKGMLVWGAGSSIGGAAVQVARLLGFRVYATASEKHHAYVKGLGARRVFDYRGSDAVERIVEAAKEDGVTLQMGFDAVGQLESCMEILSRAKGDGMAKLASAIPLREDSPTVEGVDVRFVAAPADKKETTEFIRFVFNVWLKEKLETGEFVPSPKVKVVEGGLEAVHKGLDELKGGVSGVKLVLEV